MKKSTIGVYFTGLLGPWISGINRILTDSTSFLQTQVTATQQYSASASASQAASAASVVQAQGYATAASTSESNASQYASNAQISLAAVQAILQTINAKYLGSFSIDPSRDNSGNALVDGAIYYNTTSDTVRIYENGKWTNADQATQNAMQNAINASASATAAASAAANSASSSDQSAQNSEYWANLSRQYAQNVENRSAPITAAVADCYIRVNHNGDQYQYDSFSTVLSTIGALPQTNANLLGIPTAATAATGTATRQLATCEFVLNQASSIMPQTDNGTGKIGTSLRWSREDHEHPVDTSRAALNGDSSQIFHARTFLATWGSGGAGYSFDGDSNYDTGMFAVSDGAVFFMANNVRVSEFDTTSWRSTIKHVAKAGQDVIGTQTISATGSTTVASVNVSDSIGGLAYSFGGSATHTFGSSGNFTIVGDFQARSLTTTNNLVGSSVELGSAASSISQGAYFTWNSIGGSGSTDFVNYRGLGAGGFHWFNTTPSEWTNTSDKTNLWIMDLDQSGNLTTKGTLTASALSATSGLSTLFGINLRAPNPTTNYYIAQASNPVASVMVDSNGTYHLRNSDSSDRFTCDYTYSTFTFGSNDQRADFKLGVDGSVSYDNGGTNYLTLNQNGATFGTRVTLSFNSATADLNLLTRPTSTVAGTTYTLNSVTAIGFAFGSAQFLLGSDGQAVGQTLVASTKVVAPTYLAGSGSGNGYLFANQQSTGIVMDATGNLILRSLNTDAVSVGTAGVTINVPTTFKEAANYAGELAVSTLGAYGTNSRITVQSDFYIQGQYNSGSLTSSSLIGTTINSDATRFGMGVRNDTTGSYGILTLYANNNWSQYSFYSDSINYPNGNVAIHSDNYRIGQTINGNLALGGTLQMGADVTNTGSWGGTGTNGSIQNGDTVWGGRYRSQVYDRNSAIMGTFATYAISGGGTYTGITHASTGGISNTWKFKDDKSLSCPGDVTIGNGGTLYTDNIAPAGNTSVWMNTPIDMQIGSGIRLHGSTSTAYTTTNSFNSSSTVYWQINQRNPNFGMSMWVEEYVGTRVQGVVQITNGTNNDIYFRYWDNGTFEADYIQSIAAEATYADYAENYRSRRSDIVPGTVVRIATDTDIETFSLDTDEELAPADRNGRYFFGVISTQPGHLLNREQESGKAVALAGRVPVLITGPIKRGQPVSLSDIPGIAIHGEDTLIGFAIETNLDEGIKSVEVALGGNIAR